MQQAARLRIYLPPVLAVGFFLSACGNATNEAADSIRISPETQNSQDLADKRRRLINDLEVLPAEKQSFKEVCDLWEFQLTGLNLVGDDDSLDNLLLSKLIATLQMKQLEILYHLQLRDEEMKPLYGRLMMLYLATNPRVGDENIPENEITLWNIFVQDLTQEEVEERINNLYDRMKIKCTQLLQQTSF